MPPAVKQHAFLQEDKIDSWSPPAKGIQASWCPWGMPWVGKPHWRHEVRIYTHALTLPTFLMPHSSLPPWNPNRTLSQQIVRMPSTRTGRQYSARPSMPFSPTLRQGSYVSSPSSTTSNSVLRGLPPYRWQEQIPDITLPKYGTIVNDDDNYKELMAILFPQSDLYSRTITMWHLRITAQKLRREADRQEVEARRIFIEMEGLGLQLLDFELSSVIVNSLWFKRGFKSWERSSIKQ